MSDIMVMALPDNFCFRTSMLHPGIAQTTRLSILSVCRTWKEIVLSTPRIWTRYRLYTQRDTAGGSYGYNEDGRRRSRVLFHEWMKRAGNAPLQVTAGRVDYDEFFTVLLSKRKQWSSFAFVEPGFVNPNVDLMDMLRPAQHLKRLALDLESSLNIRNWSSTVEFPHLHSLSLGVYANEDVVRMFNAPLLERLAFSSLSRGILALCFTRFPHLSSLKITGPFQRRILSTRRLFFVLGEDYDTIACERIRDLDIEMDHHSLDIEPEYEAFVDSFPNLGQLCLRNPSFVEPTQFSVRQQFTSLESLELIPNILPGTVPQAIHFLRRFPSIVKLTITKAEHRLDHLLSALSSIEERKFMVCSKLRHIVLDGCAVDKSSLSLLCVLSSTYPDVGEQTGSRVVTLKDCLLVSQYPIYNLGNMFYADSAELKNMIASLPEI